MDWDRHSAPLLPRAKISFNLIRSFLFYRAPVREMNSPSENYVFTLLLSAPLRSVARKYIFPWGRDMDSSFFFSESDRYFPSVS